jgi:hypothetical protein
LTDAISSVVVTTAATGATCPILDLTLGPLHPLDSGCTNTAIQNLLNILNGLLGG